MFQSLVQAVSDPDPSAEPVKLVLTFRWDCPACGERQTTEYFDGERA
jgi:hypothetical protein